MLEGWMSMTLGQLTVTMTLKMIPVSAEAVTLCQNLKEMTLKKTYRLLPLLLRLKWHNLQGQLHLGTSQYRKVVVCTGKV